MEVWKDIPGYEGIYQASTFGRIRTVEGKTTFTTRHGVRHWKSRILKGRGDNPKTGKRVSLWKDGKSKDWLVARLVAITFLGYPPEGFTVNHKDGNRLNNSLDNLEWLSLADNIRHAFDTGLHTTKAVELSRNGITITFESMAKCDKFLERPKGYTSNAIINGYSLCDTRGNKYSGKVVLTKKGVAMKKCENCVHYEVCGYHITEETDMSVEECAHGFKDAENYIEVCRCKDCVYASEDKELVDMYGCKLYRDIRKGSDYCNYGKRRDP